MKDFFGIEIKENDYLFYAIRDGNTAAVKLGKVLEVREKKVVIKSIQLTYRWVGKDYVAFPDNSLSKKGYLQNTEKSMIISKEKALSFSPLLE
jgi:hypothetical protein